MSSNRFASQPSAPLNAFKAWNNLDSILIELSLVVNPYCVFNHLSQIGRTFGFNESFATHVFCKLYYKSSQNTAKCKDSNQLYSYRNRPWSLINSEKSLKNVYAARLNVFLLPKIAFLAISFSNFVR